MIVTNFFKPEEREVLDALVLHTYQEVEDQIAKILKLDMFPDLMVDFTFDASKPQQPLVWMGTELETYRDNGKLKVKAITPDTMVVQVVSLYAYLKELGFERILTEMEFQMVFKEFTRNYIIYQLVKAHSLKYDYDRFIGEDATKSQRDIMEAMIQREETGYYYMALQNFYKEKLPENRIGWQFTLLNLKFIKHLDETGTVKGMSRNPQIMQSVWKIVEEVKRALVTA